MALISVPELTDNLFKGRMLQHSPRAKTTRLCPRPRWKKFGRLNGPRTSHPLGDFWPMKIPPRAAHQRSFGFGVGRRGVSSGLASFVGNFAIENGLVPSLPWIGDESPLPEGYCRLSFGYPLAQNKSECSANKYSDIHVGIQLQVRQEILNSTTTVSKLLARLSKRFPQQTR